jgi:hypothetical protein
LPIPGRAVTQHGVQRDDHFAHYSNDNRLWFLAGREQASSEGFQGSAAKIEYPAR